MALLRLHGRSGQKWEQKNNTDSIDQIQPLYCIIYIVKQKIVHELSEEEICTSPEKRLALNSIIKLVKNTIWIVCIVALFGS